MSLPSRERELKHEIADHLVVLSPSLPSRERELKLLPKGRRLTP